MTRKCTLFLLLLALVFSFRIPPASAWDIWTTSPWLALVTRFIGGVFVTVHPIEIWNDDGASSRKIQTRSIPKTARIIALDTAEAARLGLNSKEWAELAVLYQSAPFDKKRSDFFFADPSALPFIAQKIFTALSRFDPGNYPYYQRRLAEFQTRLDSTVIVGRRLLSGAPLIYLGGNFSGMLTAAGCSLLPVDDTLRSSWERGEELEKLHSLLEDALGKRVLVLVDGSSSKKLKDALRNNKEILFLGRPPLDQDLLLFFHDQYILLWNRLAALRQPRSATPSRK